MITASIQQEKYRTSLQGTSHLFYADEPAGVNGTDTAPSPEELLDAALASCTAITIRMYADRKGWELSGVDVKVDHVKENDTTRFTRYITLHGNLDEVQKQRLLGIARACPVSKILENNIAVQTELTQ